MIPGKHGKYLLCNRQHCVPDENCLYCSWKWRNAIIRTN